MKNEPTSKAKRVLNAPMDSQLRYVVSFTLQLLYHEGSSPVPVRKEG
jgi:hypothetical protein